jgi:hypothetical protein
VSTNAGVVAVCIAIVAMTPNQQPALTNIQRGSLDQLQRDFNAASDRARVILLLSPT